MDISKLRKLTKTYFINGTDKILKLSGINQYYTEMKVEISAYTENESGFFKIESNLFNDGIIYISLLGNSTLGQFTSNDIEIYQAINGDINNEYYVKVSAYDGSNIVAFRFIMTLTFSN